jgi:ubiquinone/menaquinone biosynthesis C-methylase UbiE
MDLHINAERFSGGDFTLLYDRYRPTPPDALLELAIRYRGEKIPSLLVDIGCGTGLSSFVWLDRVHKIIGIEPSPDMLRIAESKSEYYDNVYFLSSYAHELPMEDETVDIVSCSQAFHWMEPQSTLKEISRVLKPNGVLVIYDCRWPPAFDWRLELAYQQLFEKVSTLTKKHGEPMDLHWEKKEHKTNVVQSGHFKFTKTSYFHKVENGGKSQFLGSAESRGTLQALLKRGYSEEEVGLSAFKEALEQVDSLEIAPLTFHYKALYAVK